MEYLKSRDKRLGKVIEQLGMVKRPVIPNLFTALVHAVVGQQISTKAHESIWQKLQDSLGDITPETILGISPEALQAFGLSFRKVGYIREAARKTVTGEFDIQALRTMSDEDVCARLSELNGIGTWTAEMLMLHSLLRPNILSYGDLGVQRGLRLLYHHRKITKELFNKYRHRYSPYGSVACIYLWAVSNGEIEGLKDYGTQQNKTKNDKRPVVCIQYYNSPCGKIILASLGERLCLCDWNEKPCAEQNRHRLERLLNADFKEKPSGVIQRTREQLDEYFAGKRKSFDIPLYPVGTAFQKRVWAALLKIPFGETRTYLEIAQRVGNVKGVRAVAQAIGANGIGILIPCHRVIGTNGKLTGFAGGLDAKKVLLETEGIAINKM